MTGNAIAGGGWYYGIELLSHKLDNSVQIQQTFSSPPPENSITNSSAIFHYRDTGLHMGYKYRRRLTNSFYLAPELRITQLNDDYLYSTELKTGIEKNHISAHIITGISRVEQFSKNQFVYGAGVEFSLTPDISINLAWQRLDTMREYTQNTQDFGSQLVTTTTDTRRKLDIIKLGITFYFHE